MLFRSSLVFKEHEGSYLVGILAAKKSRTGVLGFLGGMDIGLIHRFAQGFEEGARSVNPNVRVVRDKDLLGVVADKEWDAIRASQQLKVEWTRPTQPFPEMERIYDHIRSTKSARRQEETKVGDVGPAFAGAARVIEAEYEWPFQSHASMGPGCAVEIGRAHV